MRVVVTGGAGYIGSVVGEVLVQGGHDVLVLDSLAKGHRDAVSEPARFAHVDLADGAAVEQHLRDFRADAVVHMAADSLVGESVANPAKYYRTNVLAGLSLLDAMRRAGVPRLVFSSTAAVYGEPLKQPIDEDDPTHPTNPYGETKLAFERALRWYAEAYGFTSVSLRYFNAAGATRRNGERHDPETHLIPLVLRAAAGLLPQLTIFGIDYATRDGTCVRDYIHVEDLANAHVLALGVLAVPGVCRAYNLGCGGGGYSVRQVIEAAERVTGRRIPVTVATRRTGDPAVLIASSDRIRRDLGWRPRQELDTIIASAWQWMGRAGLTPASDTWTTIPEGIASGSGQTRAHRASPLPELSPMAKETAKKATSKRQTAAKRELVDTGSDQRFVRRGAGGTFKESDDVGKSLSHDPRKKAKHKAKRGQGDKGDR